MLPLRPSVRARQTGSGGQTGPARPPWPDLAPLVPPPYGRPAGSLSQAQARLSRQIGIPLSRSGRQRKLGKLGGCCVPLLIGVGVLRLVGWLV